jgi:hypothetical protein
MNSANSINTQNFYENQRPFVSVTGIDLIFSQSVGNITGVYFNPHPENNGNTPTKDLVFYINYYRVRDLMSNHYHFPDTNDVIKYPAIGAPRSIIRVPEKIYTIAELAEFQNHERYLYIYGRAEYNDRFKNTPPHRTLFCFQLSNISGPDLRNLHPAPGVIETIGIDWPAWSRHNCTDDECKEQGFTE